MRAGYEVGLDSVTSRLRGTIEAQKRARDEKALAIMLFRLALVHSLFFYTTRRRVCARVIRFQACQSFTQSHEVGERW